MSVPADETAHGPREAVADWLAANGIEPGDVPLHSTILIEHDPVEGRSIHYTAVVRSDEGRIVHDPQTDGPMVVEQTAPLKADPPANVQVSEVASPADPPGL
jgi:hypothetical protein